MQPEASQWLKRAGDLLTEMKTKGMALEPWQEKLLNLLRPASGKPADGGGP